MALFLLNEAKLADTSVVMTTGAMDVTVGYFFRLRIPQADHFHIKGQGFTSQRVVGVDINEFVPDFGHQHMARAALGIHLGDHPWLPLFGTHQVLGRNTLNRIWLAWSISLIGRQGNAERIARLLASQRLSQARQNATMPMQINTGFTTAAGLNRLTGLVTQNIVEGYNGIFFNWHINSHPANGLISQ